ncbi:MAG: AsmA family protein, partial [Vibrio sp.]
LADKIRLNIKQSSAVTLNANLNHIQLTGLDLSGSLSGASLPVSPLNIALAGGLSYQLDKQQLNVTATRMKANQLQANGNLGVNTSQRIAKVRFNLNSNQVNLDKLLSDLDKPKTGANTAKPSAKGSAAKSKPKSTNGEPDLSSLKNLDVSGKLKVKQLTYQQIRFANVSTNFAINRGVVNLNQFNAGIYSGQVNVSGRLDVRQSTPSYQVKANVKQIQIQPLLKALASYDKLTGRGNMTLNASGRSLKSQNLKRNLTGSTTLSVNNGVLYGMNIPYQIRKNYALIKGRKIPAESETTKFSSFKGRFDFKSGVARTKNLALNAQGIKVTGQGQANYVKENMDFKVQADISKISDPNGKPIKELAGVSVPIRITGPWSSLNYQLDLKGLLKTQALQKVNEKAKSKIDKEIERFTDGDKEKAEVLKNAADSLLKGLFN